jgi:hypothetical protein
LKNGNNYNIKSNFCYGNIFNNSYIAAAFSTTPPTTATITATSTTAETNPMIQFI